MLYVNPLDVLKFLGILLEASVVFFSAVLSDVLWALYIKSINEKNNFAASNYGALIGLCYGISLYVLVDSFWFLFAHIAGLWIGTYYHEIFEQYLIAGVQYARKKLKQFTYFIVSLLEN